ncbi:unnamed protein product [Darwinula stevensoni]|uniref:C-type lectin domain-containing protein n=1 Tax=Darwinula stevensoni TaxID=69355 RepID=A0A7R8ZZY8_9CRUS|nr:unnamed protein product [Darwinula stevensoni]CAG0883580.1 unnamed protein product [Darwinula stevensoni]
MQSFVVLREAYLPVPNSTRYIKMVYEPYLPAQTPAYQNKNWNQSLAACKADGGWLAIDNDDTIHQYLYNILMANGIFPNYKALWIGGYSTTDKWHWELLDGTKITLTGLGQAKFAPGHPDGTGGGLHFFATLGSYCCGFWSDWDYTVAWSPGGYFCEIMLP